MRTLPFLFKGIPTCHDNGLVSPILCTQLVSYVEGRLVVDHIQTGFTVQDFGLLHLSVGEEVNNEYTITSVLKARHTEQEKYVFS